MRIGIFARRLAPYTVCFLRHLAARGHQLELIFEPAAGEAPFGGFDLGFCASALADGDGTHRRAWLQRSNAELPDAAFIAGWTDPLERAAGRRLRRLGRPVACAIDNPWTGSARQRLGCLIAPWMLRPMANIAWVAGGPQAEFARRLGYARTETGVYCADVEAYRCEVPLAARESALLFTGRLVHDKGVDLLIDAYRAYRQQVEAPLALWLAGTGPMAALAEREPGVKVLGFVQPEQLPALMARCRALVLPSRLENWGVVIHEATAAGLPILASRRCGATTAFVREGRNGLLFKPEVEPLLAALRQFHELSPAARQAMSLHSLKLALKCTPAKQALAFENLTSASDAILPLR